MTEAYAAILGQKCHCEGQSPEAIANFKNTIASLPLAKARDGRVSASLRIEIEPTNDKLKQNSVLYWCGFYSSPRIAEAYEFLLPVSQ